MERPKETQEVKDLKNYIEVKNIGKYFQGLTELDHPSGDKKGDDRNEDPVRKYVVEEAKKIENVNVVFYDEYATKPGERVIVLRRPGTKLFLHAKPIILQAHLDMVCNPYEMEFPLQLFEEEKEGGVWLGAKDKNGKASTLGADDGIGVATALAILKDKELEDYPIECLFTVQEETGMGGANNCNIDHLMGDKLVNLDSETLKEITYGSAGGCETTFKCKDFETEELKSEKLFVLEITGLKSGHSGIDVGKGRLNAIKVLFQFLQERSKNTPRICSFKRTDSDTSNSIPARANVQVCFSDNKGIETAFADFCSSLTDEGDKLTAEQYSAVESETDTPSTIFTGDASKEIIGIINEIPSGVVDPAGVKYPLDNNLIKTSTNLYEVKLDSSSRNIEIFSSNRSSDNQSFSKLLNQFVETGKKYQFQVEKEIGRYPAWQPNDSSELLNLVKSVYKWKYNNESSATVVHAGLECAVLVAKFEEAGRFLDCIAIGPTITNPHTPNERLLVKADGKDVITDFFDCVKKTIKYSVVEKVKYGSEAKLWKDTLPDWKGRLRVTPPMKNPVDVYPKVPGITYQKFELPSTGLTEEQRRSSLAQMKEYFTAQKENFLGYQVNNKLEYSEDLKEYLNFHINNIGDPFVSGNFTVNSKWTERAVLDYFASLWNAPWPNIQITEDLLEKKSDTSEQKLEKEIKRTKAMESYWGYIVSMGSTEGNYYGLWNARDYLSGKRLIVDPDKKEEMQNAIEAEGLPKQPFALTHCSGDLCDTENINNSHENSKTESNTDNWNDPVLFFSEDSHYSITKASRVLAIPTFYEKWEEKYKEKGKDNEKDLINSKSCPPLVPSNEDGSINIDALADLVEFFAKKGHPILVCFNYGTTFKGAYDDVEAAGKKLMPILREYGLLSRTVEYKNAETDERTGYWFHVDGALGAGYMPYLEMAYNLGKTEKRGPNFDFRLPFVHSIAMSGHKWMGASWPCGIYMTKVKYQLTPPMPVEYIGSPDTTFGGSRNGFSALLFWDYLTKHSFEKQIEKTLYTENMTLYAYEELLKLEKHLNAQLLDKEIDSRMKEYLESISQGEKIDLFVGKTPLALTTRFRQPNDEVVFKYSLSCEELGGKNYAHMFAMGSVTIELIDKLIKDLKQIWAFTPIVKNAQAIYSATEQDMAKSKVWGRGFR